jgi:AcrR family transcriptional regulator
MPRPAFSKLPPDRQRTILDAAASAFAEAGFAGASINAILADAGVSKGAAYYYFDDKADLFATVVERAWASVGWDVDPADLTPETWWPTLEALYCRQIAGFQTDPSMWRAAKAAGPALVDPEVGPGLSRRLEPIVAVLRSLAARAVAIGVVRADLPPGLVAAMVGGLDTAMDQWFLAHPDGASDPAVVAAAFQAMRATVEGPAKPCRASAGRG